MPAVIQPYMTPRTYASLDLFTTYMLAYTGARSAKHQEMLDLELKALDDDSLDDIIKDLYRRSRDLDKAITSLTQKDLLEQSKTERKTSKAAGADRLRVAKEIRAGEVAKQSARSQARRDMDAERDRQAEMRAEEDEKTNEFVDRVKEAKGTTEYGYAGLAATAADGDLSNQVSHYATRLSTMRTQHGGRYGEDRRNAYAYGMYITAVNKGHDDAAEYIKAEYFENLDPEHTKNRYVTEHAFQVAREEEAMRDRGVAYNVGFDPAYARAGEYADDSSSSTTTTTRTGGAEAGTVYAPELGRLEAERTMLDLQLAALYEAKLGSRAAGMNAIQQHMSMNWNFAPFALAPDRPAQEFIDRMAEEDPRRLVETMEAKEEYGTYRKMMEAQQEGEAGVFDPVRGTTTDEYASNDPGSYVMAHFYEKLKEAEGMKPSQQVAALEGVLQDLESMMTIAGLGSSTAQILALHAQVGALAVDGAAGEYKKKAGYRTIEGDGGYVYRQYVDGAIEVMEAPPDGAAMIGELQTEGPRWRALTVEAEKIAGKLKGVQRPDGEWTGAKLDGFATGTRGGERLPDAAMVEGITGAIETARAGMGANDVLFSQVMSDALMTAMAETDTDKQKLAIHDVAVKAEEMDDALTGGQHSMLAQRMELRAAEGDYQGLLDDIDRMIKAGAEPSRMAREFEEYMLQYGNVIDRQRVPTGIGEGDRRTQEQWIDLERQAQRVKAEEEAAIDLQTRARRQDVGYPDYTTVDFPGLPRLTQGGTGYRQDRQKLDDLEAEAKRLRDLIGEKSDTPGVSLTDEINALSKVTREIDLVRTREPQGSATPGLGPIEAKQEQERQQYLDARNEALDILSQNYGWEDVSELGVDPVDIVGRITDATISGDTGPLLELEQYFSEKEDELKTWSENDPTWQAQVTAAAGAAIKVRELSRGISGARSVVAEDEDELILQEAAAQ